MSRALDLQQRFLYHRGRKWRLVRWFVKIRPYALHWMEEYAKSTEKRRIKRAREGDVDDPLAESSDSDQPEKSRAWAQCVARSVRVIVLVNMCNFSATLLHECWKTRPSRFAHFACKSVSTKGAARLQKRYTLVANRVQKSCKMFFIIGIQPPSEMQLFWTRGWPKNHDCISRWVFQIWIGDTRQTGYNNSVTLRSLKRKTRREIQS